MLHSFLRPPQKKLFRKCFLHWGIRLVWCLCLGLGTCGSTFRSQSHLQGANDFTTPGWADGEMHISQDFFVWGGATILRPKLPDGINHQRKMSNVRGKRYCIYYLPPVPSGLITWCKGKGKRKPKNALNISGWWISISSSRRLQGLWNYPFGWD